MQSFNKTTLENGLRIVTIPLPDSLSSTVLILVEAGSKYERKEVNGISHFLEHMNFKGTKRRPAAGLIAKELDALGAEYNAFTGQESTGYYAKTQNKHLDKIIDIISDLTLNPIFDPAEIDKEKGVVIEEINMYEDTPMRNIHDIFTTLLYGDQPAGWKITGEKENLLKMQRDDFIQYRKEHYLAPSTLVIVAGKFNENKIIADVKNHFIDIPSEAPLKKEKTMESQASPAISAKFKESDQTHIILGVRAFDIFDERRHALEILANILGGGMSSRLFNKVRNELGAAYYVNAFSDLATDHGYLAASAGVDHRKVDVVIKAILEELNRFTLEKVSDEDLKNAKNYYTGRLFLGLEGSDDLAGFYGGQEILKREMMAPEALAEKIQKVTAEDIQKVAKDIIVNETLNLAVIGPFKDKGPFEKILALP